MDKRYWLVILTYVIAQLSGFIGIPLFLSAGLERDQAVGWWLFVSFLAALLIILSLLKQDIAERHNSRNRISRTSAAAWAIGGIFLAFFAQTVAANIELNLFGIEPGSENTQTLIELAKVAPILIIVTSLLGPILEEIIFRQIIFGSLYRKYNFIVASLISSLIFAALHQEFSHLLIYASMGLTFAYLYVKTNRIIVPIIAHVAMNSIVVLVNLSFSEKIQELEKQMQSFIGGLL